MTSPEVRIDWDGDGFETALAETPIYDRGRPITVRYGRDTGRALSPLAPGQAAFEINNQTGWYHPEDETSPLYEHLRSGAPVRITVPHPLGGDTTVFRGYVDDYEVDVDPTRKSVDVTCSDALSRLRGSTVSTALYTGLRTGEAIALLLDAAGWSEDLRDLDRGATVIPHWWCDTADAGAELDRLVDTEGPGALLTVDPDGRIVFRDRHHRLTTAASTSVQATFTGSGTGLVASAPMRYDQGWKDIINHVSLDVQVRGVADTAQQIGQAGGAVHVPDGATVPVIIRAGSPFTDAITPVSGEDYNTSGGALTVSLNRTSGQSVTVYLQATGGDAVVTDLQVRAYPLTASTITVEVEDGPSIARHGRRSWPTDREPAYASLWDVQAIAAIILGYRADRLPTITFAVRGAGNTIRQTHQLNRDLSDRIHVTAAGIDADMYIESIDHTIGAIVRDTVFACEKVPSQPAGVMILDAGVLDTSTLGQIGLDDPALMFILDTGVLGTNLLAH